MSKLKRNLLAISLVLISGGATAEKVQSQTAVDAVTSKELTAIAEAAVTSETEVKVTGNVDAALKKTPLAPRYQAAVQNKLTKNKDVRAFLVNRGEGYTGVSTKLQVQNVQVNGNTATVDATERTEYGLRDPEMIKENKKYEYNLPHRFTFTLQNGQWMLASDKVLQGPDAEPDPNNPPPAPQGTAPAGAVKLQLDAPSQKSSFNPLGADLVSFKSLSSDKEKSSISSPKLLAYTSLNRNAMVSYIYTYIYNHNTNYRDYSTNGGGGDCTNFVSQILRAGGWTDVNGYYTDYHYWWYTFASQSYAWVGAYPFYNFLNYSGRATPKNRSSDLVVGDILQANWGQGEGISHSMIVSTKHNDGTVYLSYHTNDTLDRPLSDLVATTPGASFYAWHINDTFSSLKPQTVVGKK